MITETGNDSIPFAFTFDAAEWAAVAAQLPKRLAEGVDVDAERKKYETVATTFLNLSHHHRRRNLKGSPTLKWKRVRKQITADLADAERAGIPELSGLREELRVADAAVEGFDMIGRAHQGKRNPARDWLYDAALLMWIHLGGRPTVSRAQYGSAPASGPAIDFLIAILTPVLQAKTPKAEALATFLKKTKKKRAAKPRKTATSL